MITSRMMLCSRYGEKRNAYKVLVGKLEGKRHRLEDNIKTVLREI
jgi:hypothetical protein